MRRLFVIFMAIGAATCARGGDGPDPIMVVYSDGVSSTPARMEAWRAHAGLYNAIGDWATASVNKKSRANVAAFRAQLKGFDLEADAARALACTAVEDRSQGCRPTTFDPDAHRGTIVVITPEWNSEQLMIRAVTSELDDRDGALAPRRTYTALFTSRVPRDVIKSVRKQKQALDAWWLEGSPSRLETETRRGFDEISRLLSTLAAEVGPNGEFPEKWRALQDVSDLEKSKRAACGGMGCAKAHRIVREAEGRTWLTLVNGVMLLPVPADKGVVLASFDAAALEHQVNLPVYVTMGVASY